MEIEIRSKVYGTKIVIFDDEDAEKILCHTWHLRGCPESLKTYYATCSRDHKIHMHRLVLGVTDTSVFVDHKNGNGLDNRKCNLRVCTLSQNMMNKIKSPLRKTTSKYKGVNLHRSKYRAYISVHRKHRSLGYFDNEVDAALAYNRAALELFGEFAKLNSI